MEPKEIGGTLWYSDQHAKSGSIKLNVEAALLQQFAFTFFFFFFFFFADSNPLLDFLFGFFFSYVFMIICG